MKLIYIHHYMHLQGGIPKILSFKANYLQDIGEEVIFITSNPDNNFNFPLNNNIKIYNLYSSSLLDGNFNKKIFRKNLEKILHKEEAQIVITTAYSPEFYFINNIKDGSIKICEFHGTFKFAYGFTNIKHNVRKYIFEKLFFFNLILKAKKFDQFVVLTKTDFYNWRKFLSNCSFISNPKPIDENLKSTNQEKNIIAVGRLEYVKGFTDLVYIWNLIEKDFPEWHLNIYGEGPMRKEIEKLTKEFKLQNLHLKGAKNNLKEEYLKSSIHVVTSKFEGQPLTILEAMSYGIPTISYNIEVGPKELIIDNKTGFLVEKNNYKEMSDKIKLLIKDPVLRKTLSENAFINSKNYDIEVIITHWQELFNKLLLNRRK